MGWSTETVIIELKLGLGLSLAISNCGAFGNSIFQIMSKVCPNTWKYMTKNVAVRKLSVW